MSNNFKELEKMELAQVKYKHDVIKSSISSNMGGIRLFSDMLEHFIPRAIDVLVNLTGGNITRSKRRPKYPNTPD